MAFPANPDLEVCIAHGANLASDLTTLTYGPNLAGTLVQPRVVITRGRIGGAARTQPTTIDLGLRNPNGVFSPRNISGPNYGRLRRNTPIRVRLNPGTGMVTRAIGYLPDWPTRWTGPDMDDRIPMQASGPLRRLGVGREVKSALRRSILASAPTAYWPLEDASGATSAASAIGGPPLVPSSTVRFGSFSDLPGAERTPDLTNRGRLRGAVPGISPAAWSLEFVARCAADDPFSAPFPLEWYVTGGTWAIWRLRAQTAALPLNGVGVDVAQPSGTGAVVLALPPISNYSNVWHHYRVTATQNGANVDAVLYLDGDPTPIGTLAATTLGAVYGVVVNAEFEPTRPETITGSIAHLAFYNSVLTANHTAALAAYSGEVAATRVARLATEEGVTVNVASGTTEAMGAQLPGTLPNLLRECEDADEATLIERRTGLPGFDPRRSRYNLTTTMTIPYLSVADLQPDDGDRDLANAVTVTRIGGSSATIERASGPLGTNPVTGVDRYPIPVSRSLATDAQAIQHASWLSMVGTVDEPRYVIGLNLVAHPELVTQWLACDIGSRIQVTNPPAIQVGPAPLDLIIEGYQELLDGVEWYLVIYALPYRPYEVFQIQTGTGNRSRIPAGVSTTDLAYAATATSLSVTSAVTRWIDSATYPTKFPLIIEIAGEVMTCTAITGTGLTQTFTVTRGLHGISKPLPITSAVQIWRPACIAL